jgi:uncharacterized protein YggE
MQMRQCFTILMMMMIPIMGLSHDEGSSEKRTTATIRVQGDAQVQAKPDRAQIEIGVMTRSQDPQAAASQNAQKLDQVIQQLRTQIGQNVEIKTIGYSLNPTYDYPKEGGEPKITGYAAVNTIQALTDDLTQAGKIIDAATKAGANQINSLQFILKDEAKVQSEALREAALKARSKADGLAGALGVKVVRVLHVEEGTAGVVPLQAKAMGFEAAQMDVPTPIEPGTIEISATVTLTLEIQ